LAEDRLKTSLPVVACTRLLCWALRIVPTEAVTATDRLRLRRYRLATNGTLFTEGVAGADRLRQRGHVASMSRRAILVLATRNAFKVVWLETVELLQPPPVKF
jgi:hypothetical protein